MEAFWHLLFPRLQTACVSRFWLCCLCTCLCSGHSPTPPNLLGPFLLGSCSSTPLRAVLPAALATVILVEHRRRKGRESRVFCDNPVVGPWGVHVSCPGPSFSTSEVRGRGWQRALLCPARHLLSFLRLRPSASNPTLCFHTAFSWGPCPGSSPAWRNFPAPSAGHSRNLSFQCCCQCTPTSVPRVWPCCSVSP